MYLINENNLNPVSYTSLLSSAGEMLCNGVQGTVSYIQETASAVVSTVQTVAVTKLNAIKSSAHAVIRTKLVGVAENQLHKAMDAGLEPVHFVTLLEDTIQVPHDNPEAGPVPVNGTASKLLASDAFHRFLELFFNKNAAFVQKGAWKNYVVEQMKKPVSRQQAENICSKIRGTTLISETGQVTDKNVIKVSNILLDGLTTFFTAVNVVSTDPTIEKEVPVTPNEPEFDVLLTGKEENDTDVFYDAFEDMPTTRPRTKEEIQKDWLEAVGLDQTPKEFIDSARNRIGTNLGLVVGSYIREEGNNGSNAVTQLFYDLIANIVAALTRFFAPTLLDSAYEAFMPKILPMLDTFLGETLGLSDDEKAVILKAVDDNQELFFWFFLYYATDRLAHYDNIQSSPESLDANFSSFVRAVEPQLTHLYNVASPHISNRWFKLGSGAAPYLIGVSTMKDLSEVLADLKPSKIVLPKLMDHLDRMTDIQQAGERQPVLEVIVHDELVQERLQNNE